MVNLLKIKELARQKNISLKQLAESVGITEQALHQIIRKNSTAIGTLEDIATKLDVSPCVFFTDEVGNVTIHDINGDNSGNVNNQTDKFISLLAKKDEQMDRLIGLLERGGVS